MILFSMSYSVADVLHMLCILCFCFARFLVVSVSGFCSFVFDCVL